MHKFFLRKGLQISLQKIVPSMNQVLKIRPLCSRIPSYLVFGELQFILRFLKTLLKLWRILGVIIHLNLQRGRFVKTRKVFSHGYPLQDFWYAVTYFCSFLAKNILITLPNSTIKRLLCLFDDSWKLSIKITTVL